MRSWEGGVLFVAIVVGLASGLSGLRAPASPGAGAGGAAPAASAGMPRRKAERLDIVGSDTALPLAVLWAEAFHRRRPEVAISVTGGGSGVGLASLVQGLCQVAVSSRPATREEAVLARAAGRPLEAHAAALDAVAVIVHPSNPIPALTLDDLRAIYSGRITNWREVGGPDRPLVALSRGSGSGTGQVFEEALFGPPEVRRPGEGPLRARQVPGSSLLHDDVARTPGAIGYVGVGYVTPAVLVVPLSLRPGSVPVPPIASDIRSGQYPLARAIYLYTASPPASTAQAFLTFARSPEGQAQVEVAGFVPLLDPAPAPGTPAGERRQPGQARSGGAAP